MNKFPVSGFKKGGKQMEEKTKDLIRIILSLILPPVGVFFQVGFGVHFWLNILLTLLGYFPGLIHAIWVIIKFDDKK
ncbi:Proteolipid membrane potential modulator domain-containing protein [Desulfonema magnum]|uniref:Proteolipid membrane potential modulator domain-containing protein n=2 Tax=Desulfonema magnum TaxID=45655 RepID=A0A975BP43_9BACT|nr:Proteolipid membrane potential modulator domain-containing protein [Desulfonema magnum]